MFTACYSTILATAALADAKVKEDRRKEWDRLIEEVKNPSKNVKDVQLGPETEDWEVQKPQEYPAKITAVPISTYKPIQDPGYNPSQGHSIDACRLPPRTQLPSMGEKLSRLDWKLRNSTADRVALRDVDSPHEAAMNEVGQWIDEMLDPDLENREPKTPLHLFRYQEMIHDLVNAILHQSKIFSKDARVGALSLETQQELSKMAKRFVAVNADKSFVPSFDYDNLEAVDRERKNLHNSLWALSYAASRGQTDVNLAISKICYNMLVSTVPPTITTYNILLNEFMNLGRPDLAQIVVDSFLYESRMKPNKKTIQLLLDHYRAKSDFLGFRDIVQRMRAGKEDMRIRQRHGSDLSDPNVEFWALNNKTIHRDGFLRLKTPRARPIYNSLILGSLEFNHVRAAVRHARNCLREGCEISTDTLCTVIKRVVGRLDAYAGASLLRALASQWEDGSIVTLTVYTKELRYRLYQLLLLCGIDPDSRRSWKCLPDRVSPTALSHILRRMKLDTFADAIERSASFILRLDTTLGMSDLDLAYAKMTPQTGFHQRLDQALQIARKQSKAEEIQCARKLKCKHDGQQLRLKLLENMVASAGEAVLKRQSELLEMQIMAKKIELESLIRKTVPVDQKTAEMYVRALTTDAAQPPLFADYPMFQQRKSTLDSFDPLSYLENNLFDAESKHFAWHRKRLMLIRSTDDFEIRKSLTLKRVGNLKTLLVRYTAEIRKRLLAEKDNGRKGIEYTPCQEAPEKDLPKCKYSRTQIDHEILETLERYIYKTFDPVISQPIQWERSRNPEAAAIDSTTFQSMQEGPSSIKQIESPKVSVTAMCQRNTSVTIRENERSSSSYGVGKRIPKLPPVSLTFPSLQPSSNSLTASA